MLKVVKTFYIVIGICAALQSSLVYAKDESQSQFSTHPVLTISGEVEKKVELTEQDLSKYSKIKFTAIDHLKETHSYEGILVYDILSTAGIKFGEQLRGKMLRKYLVIKAPDGYKVVFTLPELDPLFTDKKVFLVTRKDGKILSKEEGPLQIVVPEEKQQARWIRMVTTFKIESIRE